MVEKNQQWQRRFQCAHTRVSGVPKTGATGQKRPADVLKVAPQQLLRIDQ
jgi:hypothetical protein